jgi:hypothetical protein
VERQSDEVSLIERLASLDELNLQQDTAPLDKVLERVSAVTCKGKAGSGFWVEKRWICERFSPKAGDLLA